MPEPICLSFNHGLGDCCNFVRMLQLWKRRGYEVRVKRTSDKDAVFDAAGIPSCDTGRNVAWWEPAEWSRVGARVPLRAEGWSSNKIAVNLDQCWLPRIGDVIPLWEELCDEVDLSHSLETHLDDVNRKAREEGENFVLDLPRPLIGLHTFGNTNPLMKNIPNDVTEELYHRLLDTGCGLILFDWDNRVPMLKDGRVRHIKRDWKHLSIMETYSVLKHCNVLVGVDSGVYALCGLTNVPALMVTHRHYPTCVALPRSLSAVMTSKKYRHLNIPRRKRWNVIEYEGDMPTAEEIARHTMRMAYSPRYGKDRGRDVMMQQWILDWMRGGKDRLTTMDYLLSLRPGGRIVETGCIRSSEDWSGAGNSTYIFAALADSHPGLEFISVDNDPNNVMFADKEISAWRGQSGVIIADSVEFLRLYPNDKPIGLLYLDSLDTDDPRHAEHGLAEIQAAYDKLHQFSFVVYDDTWYEGGWKGKGALGVPWLQQQGWRIIRCGYQVVMNR